MCSMADMFAAMRPTLFANRKESCFPVPSVQCSVLWVNGIQPAAHLVRQDLERHRARPENRLINHRFGKYLKELSVISGDQGWISHGRS